LHWVNAQCILAYIVTNRRRNQGVCDGTRQDGVVCGMGVRRKDRELLRTFEPIVEFKRTPEHISDNGAVQHNEISDFPGLFKRLNGSISRE
jgi:hypothetical protein